MTFNKLHKWIFSLAIVASVFSFAGNATYSTSFNKNSIELVVDKKTDHKASDYYFFSFNHYVKSCCEFNFKTLLNSQNALDLIKFENVSKNALNYNYYNNFKFLKHSINQYDYHYIFIG